MTNTSKKTAQSESEAYYVQLVGSLEGKTMHNDDVDAFRHAYVSGVYAMERGKNIANILGWANELRGRRRGQPIEEENMDLWNNRVGRELASEATDKDDLARKIAEALSKGELITDIEETEGRQYDEDKPDPEDVYGVPYDQEDLEDLYESFCSDAIDHDNNLIPPWLPDALQPLDDTPGVGDGVGVRGGDPLVLDLDRDGSIELVSIENGVFYDLWQDGFAEKSGWVSADDGMLVWDKDADGKIEGFDEMISSAYPLGYLVEDNWPDFRDNLNGFAQLALMDDNGDGKIDSADDMYNTLQVWQDTNQDGITDEGELHSLSSLGITSIDVADYQLDSWNGISNGGFLHRIEGNTVTHTGTFTWGDGSVSEIADVWLDHDLQNSKYDEEYTLDIRTLFLPTFRGYGNLPDLHIAMSQNEELLTKVQNFSVGRDFSEMFTDFDNVRAEVKDILFDWAGIDQNNPAGEHWYEDGVVSYMPEYRFLEKFTGIDSQWLGTWFDETTNIPYPHSGMEAVMQSFNNVLDSYVARIIFQSGGNALFENSVTYNYIKDVFEGEIRLSQVALDDIASSISGISDMEGAWNSVAKYIDNTIGIENLNTSEVLWLENAVQSNMPSMTWDDVLQTLEIQELIGTTSDEMINGTRWNDYVRGNSGNDELYGNDGDDFLETAMGDDILSGGTGNDVLRGSYDSDTYIYTSGHDVIRESVDGSINILELPEGISKEDISFHITRNDTSFTQNIFLQIGELGTVTFENTGNGRIYDHIREVHLYDGTILNIRNMDVNIHGTDDDDFNLNTWGLEGNKHFFGYDGDDTIFTNNGGASVSVIDGGEGDDYLSGSSANGSSDIFVVSQGNDHIHYSGGDNDKIFIPEGYDVDDVGLYRTNATGSGFYDATIEVAGLGTMTIEKHFIDNGSGNYLVPVLEFFNGTSVDLTNIDFFPVRGTDGDDLIRGVGDNWVGHRNDTYLFGTGRDIIYDNFGSADKIILPDGVNVNDLTIERFDGVLEGAGWHCSYLLINDQNGNSTNIAHHFD